MENASADGVWCTWIEVRGTSGVDPGEIALIHYIINGATVSLTDPFGQQVKDSGGRLLTVEVGAREDPSALARRLARRVLRNNRACTGVPLFYAATVIV